LSFCPFSVFSGARVTQSLVLCVWFIDCCLNKTKDRVTQTPLKTEQVQKDKQQSTNHTHKAKD
jgi:hypothetical protein